MIFSSKLVHHSPPNQTNDPRRVIIYSYYPSRCAIERDVRNRPRHLAAQDFESRYKERVGRGNYVDTFAASEPNGID
jgi:hypothetical protein